MQKSIVIQNIWNQCTQLYLVHMLGDLDVQNKMKWNKMKWNETKLNKQNTQHTTAVCFVQNKI